MAAGVDPNLRWKGLLGKPKLRPDGTRDPSAASKSRPAAPEIAAGKLAQAASRFPVGGAMCRPGAIAARRRAGAP
jgi:hypothetical protein